MKKYQKSYSNLSENEKKEIINNLYVEKNISFADIAGIYDTYPNKVRRDAKKFKIPIKNKSEAQKNALRNGRHQHPTKGQKRSIDVRQKIGESVMNSWENISDEKLKERIDKSKKAWNARDENNKAEILKKANQAVRLTSKVGSKLEKFIANKLIEDGHRIKFHHEQFLVDTKLQIDIFLPSINTAIEIDGPSHFSPVWGNETLAKNKKYDNKKTGLILGKGLALIRILQTKDFSESRSRKIYDKLKQYVDLISNKFPEPKNRLIIIKDK